MITLAEAQQRLQGMLCPRCLHVQLSAVLHLVGRRECLCTARCDNCGYEFPVEGAHLETLEEVWAHVSQGLQTATCPGCYTPDFTFEFRCDLGDGYCHFVARCRSCGQVYQVLDRHTYVELTEL